MKKIHIIVLKEDISFALERLRELGIVHVEHQEELTGYQLTERREEVRVLSQMIDIVTKVKGKDYFKQEAIGDWTEEGNAILKRFADIEHYKDTIAKRQAIINHWEVWGHFEPKDIEGLASRGIFVGLYEIPISELSKVPGDAVVEIVAESGKAAKCVVVARQKLELPFDVVALPSESLNRMKELQREESGKISQLQKELKKDAKYQRSLKNILNGCLGVLQMEEAKKGMKEYKEVATLKGFCPKDACGVLEHTAQREKWGLVIEDPSAEDIVPTVIRNPRWVDIIKPVFGLINVLPGYREIDISFIFLIFFSIFFGILIGDAGYGGLLFLAAFWSQKNFGPKLKDQSVFFLVYTLSSSAILWGIFTGTYFGTLLLAKVAKPVFAWLTDFKNVQFLCFLLGAIHLSIARTWRFIMKWPSLAGFAELGWAFVIWSAFFLALNMILSMPLYGIFKYTIIAGVGLILIDILSRPKDNIFINLVLTFFSLISAFTDVVSYIRLFAVGLAGVAVADAFNEMALGIGFNHVVSGLLTTVILVVGHLFNMILCGFGILVHGIRLNVLEFSSHMGMEWTGFKYEPFRKLEQVK